MNTVTIHEAKTRLSRLIKEALRGEDVIIARGKTPLVRLTALPEARQQHLTPRRPISTITCHECSAGGWQAIS